MVSWIHVNQPPNGISIGSAVSAGLTNVANRHIERQTARPRYSVCSNRPHLMYWMHSMWPNKNISDNDYGAVVMEKPLRWAPGGRQPQTKPNNSGFEATRRLLPSKSTITICYYNLTRKVLCEMTQYSIRPKRFTIRAQAVYFLHSMMPSVTCLRLSDVSVICRLTYFQFPIKSAFLSYIGRQAAPALRRTIGFDTQYRTSDVAENLGRYLSCAEPIAQEKDFELILTVKW